MIMSETMNGLLNIILLSGYYWVLDSRNKGIIKIDIESGEGEYIPIPFFYIERDIPFFSMVAYKTYLLLIPYNELKILIYDINDNSFAVIGEQMQNAPKITACYCLGNEIWAWGLKGDVIHILDHKGRFVVKHSVKGEACDGFIGYEIAGKKVNANNADVLLISSNKHEIILFNPIERKCQEIIIDERWYDFQIVGFYSNKIILYRYNSLEKKTEIILLNINDSKYKEIKIDFEYGITEVGGCTVWNSCIYLLPFKSGCPVYINLESKTAMKIQGVPYKKESSSSNEVSYITASVYDNFLYSFFVEDQQILKIDMGSNEVELTPLYFKRSFEKSKGAVGRIQHNFMEILFARMMELN